MKCKVKLSKKAVRQIKLLTTYIAKKMIAWLRDIETLGPEEVQSKPSYRLEKLIGRRFGESSIRLNRSYRVIFKEREDKILVIEVNKHE